MKYLRQVQNEDGSIDFFETDEVQPLPPPPEPVEPPYTVKRSNAYPTVPNQLDMLWHMMDSEVISGKNSEWYNTILAVKQQYPKN